MLKIQSASVLIKVIANLNVNVIGVLFYCFTLCHTLVQIYLHMSLSYFATSFACDVETAVEELQVELIDLQADNSLKRLFENKPLVEFYESLHSEKFKNIVI